MYALKDVKRYTLGGRLPFILITDLIRVEDNNGLLFLKDIS